MPYTTHTPATHSSHDSGRPRSISDLAGDGQYLVVSISKMRGKYIAQVDLLDRDGQAVDVVEICDRRSLTYCLAECSRALANFEVLLNRGRIKLQDGSNE